MLDTTHPTHRLREAFRSDVVAGLRRTPKQLPCRWLYDDTGSLGASAVRQLNEQGFTKAFNLRGGLAAWRTENLPLTRG